MREEGRRTRTQINRGSEGVTKKKKKGEGRSGKSEVTRDVRKKNARSGDRQQTRLRVIGLNHKKKENLGVTGRE